MVGFVSRLLFNLGGNHCEFMKWILRYLEGSSKICLCFAGLKPILEDYIDADMASDLDSRKSTFGFLFIFVGEQCLGNQNCRSVLFYPLLK